jgi:rubredoxin
MKKFRCNICGYLYDEEIGDQNTGIEPGTTFEELPDNWLCPICSAGKGEFTEFE